MILHFENLGQLRTILQTDLFPSELISSPCQYGFEGESIYVSSKESLSQKDKASLRALGVKGTRKKSVLVKDCLTWAEIFPPDKDKKTSFPRSNFIFRFSKSQFISFVKDMLSQGHTSQQYVYVEDFVLCRAIDPPFFLLLKYIKDPNITVFQEVSTNSGLWIESGFSHFLANKTKTQQNLILISEDGTWTRLPPLNWVEVFDFSTFYIENDSSLKSSTEITPFSISLDLIKKRSKQPPCFWVIRENAYQQVERFVRTVPDSELENYSFNALKDSEGNLIVLLKSRKKSGSVLELKAESYMNISQVNWLYVPDNTTLHPPLRPSLIKKVFNPDPKTIVWLRPMRDSVRQIPFLTERASDTFLPLSQWVQYVISENEDPLKQWIESSIFEFDEFVDIEGEWGKKKRKSKTKPKSEKKESLENDNSSSENFIESLEEALGEISEPEELSQNLEISRLNLEPSEQERLFEERYQTFCQLDLPWDSPKRSSGWIELGNLLVGLKRDFQAVLCWTRGYWLASDKISLLSSWATFMRTHYEIQNPLIALEKESPSFPEIISCCIELIRLQKEGQPFEKLEEAQNFLAWQKPMLDQRLLWMTAKAISALSGKDPLLEAEIYDFIVQNNTTISLREIPIFIQTMSQTQEQKNSLNTLNTKLEEYLQTALTTKRSMSDPDVLRPSKILESQVRLMFAIGFGKMGEKNRALEELQKAKFLEQEIGQLDLTVNQKTLINFLFECLEEKVQEALKGENLKPPSQELHAKLISWGKTMLRYRWLQIVQHITPLRGSSGNPYLFWAQMKDGKFKERLPGEITGVQDFKEILEWVEVNDKNVIPFLNILCHHLNFVKQNEISLCLDELLNAMTNHVSFFEFFNALIPFLNRSGLTSYKETLFKNGVSDYSTLKKNYDKAYGCLCFLENINEFLLFSEECKTFLGLLEEDLKTIRASLAEDTNEKVKSDLTLLHLILVLTKSLCSENTEFSECLNLLRNFFQNLSENLSENDQGAEFQTEMYRTFERSLVVFAALAPPEITLEITDLLMSTFAKRTDGFSSNPITSVSVLKLLNNVIFSLVSDSQIFTEWMSSWTSEDGRILFHQIQEELNN